MCVFQEIKKEEKFKSKKFKKNFNIKFIMIQKKKSYCLWNKNLVKNNRNTLSLTNEPGWKL